MLDNSLRYTLRNITTYYMDNNITLETVDKQYENGYTTSAAASASATATAATATATATTASDSATATTASDSATATAASDSATATTTATSDSAQQSINLESLVIVDENTALNVMISFLHIAQKRGAFNLQESAKAWECIQLFMKK
jgi:cytoskeletal protein RodZ